MSKQVAEWTKSYSGKVIPDQLVMNIEIDPEQSFDISHMVDINSYSENYKLWEIIARLLAICMFMFEYGKCCKKTNKMWIISAQENV